MWKNEIALCFGTSPRKHKMIDKNGWQFRCEF